MAYVSDTPLKVGFHPPEQCVRGRTDCRSLSQIIATEGEQTFMCCGEREPATITGEPSDKWRFCHRSIMGRSHTQGVDVLFNVNRYDMAHMAGVVSMGLAMVAPFDNEEPTASETALQSQAPRP